MFGLRRKRDKPAEPADQPAPSRPRWQPGDSVTVDGWGDGVVCGEPQHFAGRDRFPVAFLVNRRTGEGHTQSFLASEMHPGPALPSFGVGDRLVMWEHRGEIVGEEAGQLVVEFAVRRLDGDVETARRHRVPAWQVRLSATPAPQSNGDEDAAQV